MAWLNIFGRLTGYPASTGDSCDDWQPGDLAECVIDDWFNLDETGRAEFRAPALGEIRVVSVVIVPKHSLLLPPVQFLSFQHFGERRYAASGFRKITPRADAAAMAEPAFLELIRKTTAPQTEDA